MLPFLRIWGSFLDYLLQIITKIDQLCIILTVNRFVLASKAFYVKKYNKMLSCNFALLQKFWTTDQFWTLNFPMLLVSKDIDI